jgi:hypothetical protein
MHLEDGRLRGANCVGATKGSVEHGFMETPRPSRGAEPGRPEVEKMFDSRLEALDDMPARYILLNIATVAQVGRFEKRRSMRGALPDQCSKSHDQSFGSRPIWLDLH